MTWAQADARTDLRTLISDGPKDRLSHRKALFGEQNGTNKIFKTLEARRVNDFTSSSNSASIGVFLDQVKIPPTDITSDDTEIGEFVLRNAPTGGQELRATYYYQEFFDTEIDLFLKAGAQWCLGVTGLDGIPDGLKEATLHYGAAQAYQKLAERWSRRITETYRVEDAEDTERFNIVDTYKRCADSERKIAQEYRQNYYQRNDQARAPLYTSVAGAVPRVQPKR